MSKKPIGPTLHGQLDYGFLAALALAPDLLKFKGSARTLCYLFAGIIGVTNAFSQHSVAVKRIIPMKVHGQLETPFVPSLLFLPWVTGALRQVNALVFFSSFFVVALTNYLLTDYEISEP